MRVPVVWLAPDEVTPGSGYWDQALLADLLDGRLWRPTDPVSFYNCAVEHLPGALGAVVVVPGARATVEAIVDATWHLNWLLLIVTSDEECRFDPAELPAQPRRLVWLQYPHPDKRADADAYLPVGYAPGTPRLAAEAPRGARGLRWCFQGQVTHPKRLAASTALQGLPGGLLGGTGGFAQGVPHAEYVANLANAVVAPAPPGPCSADSFRVWEALEAGAVPVVGDRAYWQLLLGEEPPFPIVTDWADLPGHINELCTDPFAGAEASAWWQHTKRELTQLLHQHVRWLARPIGGGAPQGNLADLITVVVPTSPIPSHPDLAILNVTLDSVRAQLGPDVEVIVTADGLRPEQAHYQEPYAQAVTELVARCEHDWPQVLPVVHRTHQHQARMMRHALQLVTTPLVLYVEHDTPLEGPIDWGAATRLLLRDEGDLVRFHHESEVLDVHRHLMVGQPEQHGGIELWRTSQWSQRPHLARADYYRQVLADHFDPEDRWMIEDRMHSVVARAAERGRAGWQQHRLWMYHQADGGRGIRRSYHLDGRGDDPKWVDR